MYTANQKTVVSMLKNAQTVEHWNEIRDNLKSTIPSKEMAQIDASGLIVETLGADKHFPRPFYEQFD
jgi:aryl-alcohol dehydrogenase-like predicted oxidoreductase